MDAMPRYILEIAGFADFIGSVAYNNQLSLRNLWFSPGRDMETLARQWVRDAATAREQGRQCDRYIEVRYEDLVSDSKRVLNGRF